MKTAGQGAAALAIQGCSAVSRLRKNKPEQTAIPRWRGFNLLNFFRVRGKDKNRDMTPIEDDFRWMSGWGFDFVRLPMSYPLWLNADYSNAKEIGRDDVYKIKQSTLEKVDRTVDLARKYGMHISLNFHRAPGYCVNSELNEPFNLWTDKEALDAFCYHWSIFAGRYKELPPSQISFDLVNEPNAPGTNGLTHATYEYVVRTATKTIRDINPEHLVVADGLRWGRIPLPELVDLGIAQSCRGYDPQGAMSHFRASWGGGLKSPEPIWPGLEYNGEIWDRNRLEKVYAPWVELAKQGIGVHCGEAGCYSKTPHEPFLAWFRDVLDILTGHGIGYGIWNFRGSFGILDSGRKDVAYEDWYGHKLDRKYLELLQEF